MEAAEEAPVVEAPIEKPVPAKRKRGAEVSEESEAKPARRGRRQAETPSSQLEPSQPPPPPSLPASSVSVLAEVRVIFTGIEKEEELVRAIGAEITEDPLEATHMVIGELKRTPKLMVAINAGVQHVVGLDWLQKSAKKGTPLPVTKASKFLIKDAAKEKLWGFELSRTLALPRGAGHDGVFEGLVVLVTPGVCGVRSPKEEDFAAIVTSGGGRWLTPSMEAPEDAERLLVVSSAEVAPTVPRALVEAASRGPGRGLYSTEAVFLAVLRQELRLDEDLLDVPAPAAETKKATKKSSKK